ncbi:hypothetical protein VNI00_008966 [Paramarasmius palmivorus]|uniref:Uncharacterized protein n=1 Tax=Paramarasmius palmivorus TaxID=297713 RepID=A0AAW0CRU0_9AGAR
MAGIAPTLIILRSTLNKSAESVPQVLSTLRFEERDPAVVTSNSDIEATVSSQQSPGKEGIGL